MNDSSAPGNAHEVVDDRLDLETLAGPFYDAAGLASWLGVSERVLVAQTKTYALLACPLKDGTSVFPAWQFRRDRTRIPHLDGVLQILLPAASSPWTVATWLRIALPEFGGGDAATWLDSGADPERVRAAAQEDADQWSG